MEPSVVPRAGCDRAPRGERRQFPLFERRSAHSRFTRAWRLANGRPDKRAVAREKGKEPGRMGAKMGGGGGGKFDLGQNADMNVTPFVDVMLVLLIIFMV